MSVAGIIFDISFNGKIKNIEGDIVYVKGFFKKRT